ncbi:MAG: acyl-CoA thioesterase [Schleiferiaceae bacterium]|jgi:acyl-CoA thioester hydrolase|nr:acyl-CoA thioesterase [Schleiferiaceae bacterium]
MKYIENEIYLNVRFSEVDSLGIVWHGNYLKFFEDGRESLGLIYGMSYQELYDKRLVVPIVDTQISFKSVVKFGDKLKLVTRFYKQKAAKLHYKYWVYNETTGQLSATGSTTQVFVNEELELQLFTPEVFEEWKNSLDWKEE